MSMDRRQMFKFVAGAAIGVAVPGTATQELGEGTFAQMDDTPKEYFPSDQPELILTDVDLAVVGEDLTRQELRVHDGTGASVSLFLPNPTAGKELYVKNPKTCESLRLIGDGKLWHII